MNDTPSSEDQDPAPLQHTDAERVTDEQAEDLPEGSRGESRADEEE